MFQLAESGRAMLTVYDVRGRQLRSLFDEALTSGRHEVIWDGRDSNGRTVGSGPYFVQLQTRDAIDTKRIMLLK